jgi:hypothetical protein
MSRGVILKIPAFPARIGASAVLPPLARRSGGPEARRHGGPEAERSGES